MERGNETVELHFEGLPRKYSAKPSDFAHRKVHSDRSLYVAIVHSVVSIVLSFHCLFQWSPSAHLTLLGPRNI